MKELAKKVTGKFGKVTVPDSVVAVGAGHVVGFSKGQDKSVWKISTKKIRRGW